MTETDLFHILFNSLIIGNVILLLLGVSKKTPHVKRSINNLHLINSFIAILALGCGINLLIQ